MKKTKAFIDIGSNSLTLLIVEYEKRNLLSFKTIYRKSVTTNLAKFSNQTQCFYQPGVSLIESELLDFCNKCAHYGILPQSITAVATAISRNLPVQAKSTFLNFKLNTGIDVKVISSNEEARLSKLSLEYFLLSELKRDDKFVCYDQGGASTEFSIVNTDYSLSIPFGAYTWNESLMKLQDASSIEKFLKSNCMLCTFGIVNNIVQILNSKDFTVIENEISVHGHEVVFCEENIAKLHALRLQSQEKEFVTSHYPFLGKRADCFHQALSLLTYLVTEFSPKSLICTNLGLVEGLAIDQLPKWK
jgi:hypothetical protein